MYFINYFPLKLLVIYNSRRTMSLIRFYIVTILYINCSILLVKFNYKVWYIVIILNAISIAQSKISNAIKLKQIPTKQLKLNVIAGTKQPL